MGRVGAVDELAPCGSPSLVARTEATRGAHENNQHDTDTATNEQHENNTTNDSTTPRSWIHNESDDTSDQDERPLTDPNSDLADDNHHPEPDSDSQIAHHNKSIPTPRLSSLNVNSLSNGATTVDGTTRRSNIKECIKSLAHTSDIITLQETQLPLNEKRALTTDFPRWEIYFSNAGTDTPNGSCQCQRCNPPRNSRGTKSKLRAGAITMIRKSFAKHYSIEEIDGVLGHVQALDFHPKEERDQHGFRVTNCYLSNCNNRKEDELTTLLKMKKGYRHKYVLGDFKFVEDADDASSENKLNAKCQATWDKIKDSLHLVEAYQPAHTYWRLNSNKDDLASSRLDRIYHSHREAEQAIFRPTAFIPNMPFNAIDKQRHQLRYGHTPTSMNGPDHLPISLHHISTERKGKRQRNFPDWVFSCPGFYDEFMKNWTSNRGSFEGYEDFKKCLKVTARKIQVFKLDNSAPTIAKDLSISIAALRELQKPTHEQDTIKLDRLKKASPCLRRCGSNGGLDADKVTEALTAF
jgi:exonuclease III